MTLPALDLRLLWPEILLAAGAMVLMLAGARRTRAGGVRAIAVAVQAAALGTVLVLGAAGEGAGPMYVRDGLTVVLQVTALLAALVATALGGEYVERTALDRRLCSMT